jgi:hypothetical protein
MATSGLIGGIGEHLLIAGHRGVETNLAGLRLSSAKRDPAKDGSILESKYCIHHGIMMFPPCQRQIFR